MNQPTHSMFEPTPLGARPWPFMPEQMIPELLKLKPELGGHIVKNPLIDGVDIWHQAFDPNPTITVAANGEAQGIWRIPPASNLLGDVEMFYFMSEHTGRYLAEGHLVGSYDRLMMNAPISVNMLAGTAQLPAELAESIFMESAGTILWRLLDVSGQANNITLTGFGRQFINYDIVGMSRESVVEAFRQRASHPYWLTFDQTENNTGGITLNANETRENATLEMTVPGDGDLVVYDILDDSDGDYTIEMFSGRAGKRNSSGPIPRALFAGITTSGAVFTRRAAAYPFRLRQPRLYNRQTKITFRITNLEAQANTIRIALVGRKVYYPELGKAPIELLGRYLQPRPIATHGSGMAPGVVNPQLQGTSPWPGIVPQWGGVPGYRTS